MTSRSNKIILALGGGAARGAAHIGVLRGLEEDGIQVAAVAGTSMGAIVGAMIAEGLSSEEMAEVFDAVNNLAVGRIVVGSVVGNAFWDLLREILGSGSIQALKMPYAAVCCDVESGGEVVLREGSVADAARASSAIPGILSPMRIGGHVLIDGGMVNPVPITAAHALGDLPVLGVNVLRPPRPGERPMPPTPVEPRSPGRSSRLERLEEWVRRRRNPSDQDKPSPDEFVPGRWEVVERGFNIIQYQLAVAMCGGEETIEPDVGRFGWFDFGDSQSIIEEGYRAWRRYRSA